MRIAVLNNINEELVGQTVEFTDLTCYDAMGANQYIAQSNYDLFVWMDNHNFAHNKTLEILLDQFKKEEKIGLLYSNRYYGENTNYYPSYSEKHIKNRTLIEGPIVLRQDFSFSPQIQFLHSLYLLKNNYDKCICWHIPEPLFSCKEHQRNINRDLNIIFNE